MKKEMREGKRFLGIISCLSIAMVIVAVCFVSFFAKNSKIVSSSEQLKNAENQIALSYGTADASTNSDYVQFSAFFTRDVNGNAEKLAGTCKKIAEKDTLYLDINVLSDGYLEDGAVMTIEDANFAYKVNLPADEVLKSGIISDNATSFTLNQMKAGTQKLIQGEISADLGNNVDNYSKEVTVRLVATHVSNNGVRTPINVEKKVTVDWYGDLETEIFVYKNYSKEGNTEDDSIYYYYKDFKKSIDSESNTETPAKNSAVTVSFAMDEIKKELLLKENSIDITIPNLNGKAPEKVKCINSDVSIEKIEDTENGQKYRLTKNAVIGNDNVITKKLADENTYTISIKYPAEAYEAINDETTLNIDVQGYYIAYNNPNEDLNLYKDPQIAQNESKSNVASKTIKVIFKKYEEVEHGTIDFDVTILDKKYNEMKNCFVISKDSLVKWFDEEETTDKFEYKVEWDAIVKGENQNSIIKMSEGQAETIVGEENQETKYGDTFNKNYLENYIINNGIYFENVEDVLGSQGSISIYNNDTNELVKTLTVEEAKTYTKENPLMFEEQVKQNLKHIRIETTTVVNTETKVLKVITLKEINKELFKADYTKDDIDDIEILNTQLEGVLQSNSTTDASGAVLTVKSYDSVHLFNKTSYAEIEVETKQISTVKMLENEKIFIKTIANNNEFDSEWKNGNFVVEIPQEIAGIAINSITADNGVTIESWDLSEVDGRNVLKIKTVNENPTLFTITIDCNVTPDYKINSTTKEFKLYYYNEIANRYYNLNEDKFDVNENTSVDENVGYAETEVEFISAQELITFETVSNYTKVSKDSEEWSNKISIAPEVAEVDNNEGLATINVVLKNGYKKSINNIKVLGRIPFEGNKNVLNNQDMSSEFTAIINKNGLNIPQELQGKIDIYYSANENADVDLTKELNGWKKIDEFSSEEDLVAFMNTVKSYFIDFKEAELEGEKEYTFSYNVAIPETVDYNTISYSNHAAYYDVESADGTLKIETEPAKVGIKIVRKFNLQIKTYDKKEGTLLTGAVYRIIWNENNSEKYVDISADEEGNVVAYNLLEGTEYILKQSIEPETYMPNNCSLAFKIVVDESGKTQFEIISDSGLVRSDVNTNEKDIIVNKRDVSIGVENEKGKRIVVNKIDEEDSTPLQNVEFDIYSVDNNLNDNEKVFSSVKTDVNGRISIWLAPGFYKVVERTAVDNYQLPINLEDRTRYFEVKENEEETNIYPINTIEDLVELSRLVNSGDESIKTKTVKLMKNLDFKSDSSYREYEDENTLKNLKVSLLSGNGFTPIGNQAHPFSGTFDGNGYEIRNIYIYAKGDVGLFGYASGAQIKNLGLASGTIINSKEQWGSVGGIVGFITDNGNLENVNIISNCYNNATISGGNHIGGIIGQSVGKATIANCYNSGNLSGMAAYVSGIIGRAVPSNSESSIYCSVLNCYNTGKLTHYSSSASGIAGNLNCGQIVNCYNLGELEGSSNCGICTAGSSVTIKDCYYLSTTAEKGANITQDTEGIVERKTLEEINSVTFADLLNQNIDDIESEIPLQTWYSGVENTNPKFVKNTDNIVITNKMENQEESLDYDAIVANRYERQFEVEKNEIVKLAEDTGYPLRAFFTFHRNTGNFSMETDMNGSIDISNWEKGDYTATETSVLGDYILESSQDVKFTIGEKKYKKNNDFEVYVNYIEDLIEIAENVNTAKMTTKEKTIYLLRDLDMDSTESYRNPNAQSKYDYNKNGTLETLWNELHTDGCNYGLIPIGKGPYFYGNFDGCGHALINFKIGQGEPNTGLFSNICNGSVTNLEIKGNTIVNGSYNVGTIAGYATNATIENCCSYYSTGGNVIEGIGNVGGIVGNISETVIKNCFNANNIIITNSSSSNYGGIVGYGNNGQIINCYNKGNIIIENGSCVGGICGGGSSDIVNCYNEGEIIGKYQVGGINANAGNNSRILNSYNKGHIKAFSSPASGIYNTSSNENPLQIENNYNFGLVEFNIDGKMRSYIGQITAGPNNQSFKKNYYVRDGGIDYEQSGTGLSKYYMQSKNFVELLNENKESINTTYTLSKWIITDDTPTLENVGVIDTGVDISKNYTYNISTASQLREFASKMNAGQISGNVKVVLRNDIDLENQEFTPIGTAENPFRGVFEGNGHVIKNLNISKRTNTYSSKYDNLYYAGFLGVVESASINNLGIEGKIKITNNAGGNNVGGLIGIAIPNTEDSIVINKCYSKVNIDAEYNVGGLIGYCRNSGKVFVYNSFNSGNLTIKYGRAAGIVSDCHNNVYLEIINCYNSGNIGGEYNSIYGIAAVADKIENCINVGELRKNTYTTIYGISSSIADNSYYLKGDNYATTQQGIKKTEEQMKSKEFWNTLNDNKEKIVSEIGVRTWKYNANSYPTLGLTESGFKDYDDYIQILNERAETVEIVKEDEETNEKLAGAEFKVETLKEEDRYTAYPSIGEKQYYGHNHQEDFVKKGNSYISDNQISYAYFVIDLRGYNEQCSLNYTARIKGGYNTDYGRTYLSTVSYTDYTESTKKMEMTLNDSRTCTIPLTPNSINYFIIRHSGTNNWSSVRGIFEISNMYLSFKGESVDENNVYDSTMLGTDDRCIHIDLRNKTGRFLLALNASIKSKENSNYGYALINSSSGSTISDNDIENAFLHISGNVNNGNYNVDLEGGQEYYLHIGCKIGDSSDTTTEFVIKSAKLNKINERTVITNEQGKTNFKVSKGEWVRITETKAPNDYVLEEHKEVISSVNQDVQLTVSNKRETNPYAFTINKTDEDGNALSGVKFEIYKVKVNGETIDFAKNRSGRYVGENENNKYRLTTDDTGKISVTLEDGLYKAVEVEAPEGYSTKDADEIYFKVSNEGTENIDLEINKIEDLVRLSNEVNSGNNYEGKYVKLMNTLNFNEDSSYENPDDTSFGDYNGDGTTEGIKEELTKTSQGCGFVPIGGKNSGLYSFNGTFDGNNKEINGLYIKNTSMDVVGLFGIIKGATIKNLKVSGNVIVNRNNSTQLNVAGIVGFAGNESKIINCENSANVTVTNNNYIFAGGINGLMDDSCISNCNNKGNISITTSRQNCYAGGISGYSRTAFIENCSNEGSVSATETVSGSYWAITGGILGYSDNNSYVDKVFNKGNVTSSSFGYPVAGGIVGCDNSPCRGINNSCNIGEVSANSKTYRSKYIGGILGYAQTDNPVRNSVNLSKLKSLDTNSTYIGGIIGYASTNVNVENVLSRTEIEAQSGYKGGLVGYANSLSTFKNAYHNYTRGNGNSSVDYGYSLTDEQIKSDEFLKLFNTETRGIRWIHNANNYPIIDLSIATERLNSDETMANITNYSKTYKITTKVGNGPDGFSNNGNISGRDLFAYEIVDHGQNSNKPIVVTPYEGYAIDKITINGEKINFNTDENGNYTLPQFIEMNENKEVVVTFIKENKYNFILDKTNDEGEKLQGVKFCIYDEQGDFAKEFSGNYVGVKETIDGEEKYVVTTDRNGQVKLKLRKGKYKVVEVETLEGYLLDTEEREFDNVNEDAKINWEASRIWANNPYSNYLQATNDGAMIEAVYGYYGMITSDKMANNQNKQVESGKGSIFKYDNNGKIEKVLQFDGIEGFNIVYQDSNNDYLVIGYGKQAIIPAADTVNNQAITLSYDGTSNRTIILKLNSNMKVIYAKAFDSFYVQYDNNTYIKENKSGNYFININGYTATTDNVITISAENTVNNQQIQFTKNNNNLFIELTKDGKINKVFQNGISFNYLIEKENGGYLLSMPFPMVYQYDANFNQVKVSSIYGPVSYLCLTQDEGFVTIGTYTGDIVINGDNTVNGQEIRIHTDQDTVLIKYNKDFKVEWVKSKSFASADKSESVYKIIQDSQGNYIVLIMVGGQYKLVKIDEDINVINCINIDGSSVDSIFYESSNLSNYIIQRGDQSKWVNVSFGSDTTTATTMSLINHKKCQIIVHHYKKGTGPEFGNEPIQLADDEISENLQGKPYTTAPKDDIEGYKLETDELGDDIIPENANGQYTLEVQEIFYYYEEVDEHKITAQVEVPEGRTEKGGKITGDITINPDFVIEEIEYRKASTKDILIEPDTGYRVKEVRLISTDSDGNKKETIVYGEDSDIDTEVKARLLKDGKMILTKFTNVKEDKHIVVVFEPDEGSVIVHHYIENTTEKISKDEITKDIIGTVVETNPVNKERYVLISGPEGEERNPTIENSLQERIYYYQLEHQITTDVIEHNELYVDKDSEGNITERNERNVKGGAISGEDEEPYEAVIRYRDNTKKIEVTPSSGYEIVSVTINDEVFDYKNSSSTNDKVTFDENGKLTLDEAFFTSMEEDKHIEVSFKKKSKVIVKYLEEETGKVLYKTPDNKDFIEILGLEGDDFSTEHKIIPGYKDSTLGITDEDGINISDYSRVQIESNAAEGNMYANEITIIYWYKRIESKAIERHIEINEKGETTELANREFDGYALDTETTRRMNFGEEYISVDGPENSNPAVTVVGKDVNSKEVTLAEEGTNEVWYYYEKQFKVTTEVKPHIEKDVDGNDVEVDGGTISKEYKKDENGEFVLDSNGNKIEVTYESILNRGDSTKEIVIKPDELYRIKSITINNESINLDSFTKAEDGSITLPEKYFEDVKEDKHVVVEFEKIPAKVIVKYLDVSTGEEVLDDKVVEGHVKDQYDEQRVDVDGYIPADPEPDNSVGEMTEETITVIYYYTKQFIITTDVKEHEEFEGKNIVDVIVENGDGSSPSGGQESSDSESRPKVQVKGGSITGELTPENDSPVEIVERGKDSTKVIVMKPDEKYRIKSITIYEGEQDENGEFTDKGYEIDIEELTQKDGTVVIPEKYFKDMQSNKHIVVEYEKIPAKVIVNYKEKSTEEDVAKQLTGEGFVGDEYITYEQEIPYYELLKDELPENAEGVLVEGDTVVNYWYRRFLFNMKLEKEFTSIKVNGSEFLSDDHKFGRVEIQNTKLNDTNITVKYKITVTNTEEVAGIAKIIEQIPVGFKFVNSEADGWITSENEEITSRSFELITKELQPGESAEYEVILEWDANTRYVGNFENIARIAETQNIPEFDETTLEDNQDSCMLVLSIKTGEDESVSKIIYIACLVLAGICTVVYVGNEIYYRKKDK